PSSQVLHTPLSSLDQSNQDGGQTDAAPSHNKEQNRRFIMWKKAIVAVLVLTIAAAVVVAVIDNMPSALAAGQPAADATPMPAASGNQFGGGGQGAGQHGQSNQESGAAVQQQLNQSVDNVGEAWTAAVTVVELGDVGM